MVVLQEQKKCILNEEDITKGSLILINAKHLLKTKILDLQLEPFDDRYPDMLLQKEMNHFLQLVLKEIGANDQIIPVSAYRTKKEQEQIMEDSIKENGKDFTEKYVAFPDASEHQTGLAIDLGLNKGEIDFICPSFPRIGICQKFRDCSLNYGFIERYQEEKKDITQISAEEWHFRYVGYPHSCIMNENHFCLEEYIEYLRQKKTIQYHHYTIAYIPYLNHPIEIDMNENVQISGNNIDGFIITKLNF